MRLSPVVFFLSACTTEIADEPPLHARDDGPAEAAVTCGATLERYPVAGPHNGGWDRDATTFSCAHVDNSDYYTGAGGANHQGGHLGNDLFGARGTPIVAARGGTVVELVRWSTIGGNNVSIRDACGWWTYYAHLDAIDASLHVGKVVAAGDPIGALGDTGQARGTTPHLHFSLFPDGSYGRGVDPFPYLQAVDHTACPVEEQAPPPPDPTTSTCGDYAAATATERLCEWNGNGACFGGGPGTLDCDHCCTPPPDAASSTCGDLAAATGTQRLCEWNGNGACGGAGPRTVDCDACCAY